MDTIITPTGLTVRRVTGYDAVREVLGDDDRFSSRAGQMAHVMPTIDPDGPIIDGDFTRMDGAAHRRLRGLLVHEMAVTRRSARFRATVARTVDHQLDELSGLTGPVDLLAGFARPVTMALLIDLLGLPTTVAGLLRSSADAIVSQEHDGDDMLRALAPMFAYLKETIQARRADPGSDLISRLVMSSDVIAHPLTDGELTAVVGTVFGNGFDSTAGTLAHCVLCLFEHPAELDRLRADPALLPTALEELLRHQGAGSDMLRVVTRDTEVAGTRLTEGEFVVADIGSACFDPSRFHRPHDLDLTRTPNNHLAFGHGTHRCAGEQVARLELELALEALLRRIPTLRLAVPIGEIDLDNGSSTPGPVALPVTWDRVLPAHPQEESS